MPGIILSTINARYMHASLGLRWLYANLGELQAHACIQEYCLSDQVTDIAEKIMANDPDIVGIGVYIWNVLEVRQLVAILKRVAPAIRIVLGGPEVSHLPLRVELNEADYMIQGEGEFAFPALCRSLLAGQAPAETIITASPVNVTSLNLPYRFYTDADLTHRVTYVEASRGCPFSCEFCLSSLDRQVRAFGIDRFLSAMEQLWQRGARTFKFVDRTFNSNPSAAGRILDYFLGKEPPFNVHFEVIPDHFPPSLKERFTRFPAGVLQLEVGIQTLHPETAAHISRRLDFDRIKENLSFLARETAAHLHVDLIVGLPGESVDQFGENLNILTRLTKGEIQIGILKKLSGTAINRHDRQFAMVYSPFPPYEILCNNLIPFARMQEMKRLARFWDMIYNSGNFKQTAPLLWADEDVFQGFFAFSRWLYSTTQTTWQIGLPRLADLLFHYLVDEQSRDQIEVANSLAADILVFKGRALPAAVRKHVTRLPHQQALPGNLTRRQSRHQQGADRG